MIINYIYIYIYENDMFIQKVNKASFFNSTCSQHKSMQHGIFFGGRGGRKSDWYQIIC